MRALQKCAGMSRSSVSGLEITTPESPKSILLLPARARVCVCVQQKCHDANCNVSSSFDPWHHFDSLLGNRSAQDLPPAPLACSKLPVHFSAHFPHPLALSPPTGHCNFFPTPIPPSSHSRAVKLWLVMPLPPYPKSLPRNTLGNPKRNGLCAGWSAASLFLGAAFCSTSAGMRD